MLVGRQVGVRLGVGVIVFRHRAEFDRVEFAVLRDQDPHALRGWVAADCAAIANEEFAVGGLGVMDRPEGRGDVVAGDLASGEVFALEIVFAGVVAEIVVVPDGRAVGGPEFVAGNLIVLRALED